MPLSASPLSAASRGLVRARRTSVRITNHMEVVMVNVENFYTLFVVKSIRYRPSVDRPLFEVDCAFVVCVMQLSEADQRNEPRIVDVVRNLFLDDSNSIALLFKQQRDSATDRPSLFKSMDNFIVTRWIDSCDWSTCGQWPHDGDASVSLVNVELYFLIVLQVWADRNRDTERPECDIGKTDTSSLRANRS